MDANNEIYTWNKVNAGIRQHLGASSTTRILRTLRLVYGKKTYYSHNEATAAVMARGYGAAVALRMTRSIKKETTDV